MRKIFLFVFVVTLFSCALKEGVEDMSNKRNIVLLAHSTGTNLFNQGKVTEWFDEYNRDNNTNYNIELRTFPKKRFYGWNNYPYDYWNIWVKHKGYKFEPSLKKLARNNDVIIWKHCFPGSAIEEDRDVPFIDDQVKSLAAYKLQYGALKDLMLQFPDTDFIVWTLAVVREGNIPEEQAMRAREFVDWVKSEWDESGDNIHVWDFYGYETTSIDGQDQSLYLRPEYASSDNHPNPEFNKRVAPYFCKKIVEVLEKK